MGEVLCEMYNSFWFWGIFPWTVTVASFAVCNVLVLLYALKYYAHDTELLFGWLQSLAIAFAIGWLVFDPFIILVRNNLSCTKHVIKTRQYQVAAEIRRQTTNRRLANH